MPGRSRSRAARTRASGPRLDWPPGARRIAHLIARSRVRPLFTWSVDVRRAARADFGMPGNSADIGAMMPATDAFRLPARRDAQPYALTRGHGAFRRRRHLHDLRLRCDEEKPQLPA